MLTSDNRIATNENITVEIIIDKLKKSKIIKPIHNSFMINPDNTNVEISSHEKERFKGFY